MDPTTLVTPEQIQGGEDLLKFLPSRSVSVTGAAWAQIEGEGQPHLYIVSPDVDVTPLRTTRQFVDAFRAFESTCTNPFRRLDIFAVRLLGPSDPLARGIQDIIERYPDDRPTYHRGMSLGFVSIDEAYIYPASLFAAPAAPPA